MLPQLNADCNPFAEGALYSAPIYDRVERTWRCPNAGTLQRADDLGRIFVSRWKHSGSGPLQVSTVGNLTHHLVTINLGFTSVRVMEGEDTILDGTLAPGAIYVSPPGAAANAVYHSDCDELHVFVTQAVLAQCFIDVFGRSLTGTIHLDEPRIFRDLTIERLAQLLANEGGWETNKKTIFCDSIARAIVSCLIEKWYTEPQRVQKRPCGLVRWRLRRATEFIEEHLGDKIRLDDIAQSAGLSRMHFAAQFRVTTGVSPHEYVLRRRIEFAKTLLRESSSPTLDIALQCGFGSQAHFIQVFSRYIGDTPSRWRRNLDEHGEE